MVDTALRNELARFPLFADLDTEALHGLVVQSQVVELAQGEVLFHQGDDSERLYVVVEGAVVPIAEGSSRRKLAVLERGELVGEIGLVTRQPRNATVAALVESKLLALDRSALFPVMRRVPELARGILAPARSRMLDRQLRTNPFFAAFSPAEQVAVARQFRLVEVLKGARIMRQGEPPEGLFIVVAGSYARRDALGAKRIGRVGIGDLFGGDALIAARPAQYDVVAESRGHVLVLGERRFRRLVEANPRLVRIVERFSCETQALPPKKSGRPRPRRSAFSPLPEQAPRPARNPSPPASASDRSGKRPSASPRAASAGRAPRSRS